MALCYVAALIVASLLPSGPGAFQGWDAAISPTWQNAMHAPAYALLAMLGAAALARPTAGRITLVALACCALGGALECAQAGIPGRTASVSDILTNLAGVAVGVTAVLVWKLVTRGRKAVVRGCSTD